MENLEIVKIKESIAFCNVLKKGYDKKTIIITKEEGIILFSEETELNCCKIYSTKKKINEPELEKILIKYYAKNAYINYFKTEMPKQSYVSLVEECSIEDIEATNEMLHPANYENLKNK